MDVENLMILRFKEKEVDLIVDLIATIHMYFNGLYSWTDEIIDGKNVSKVTFITPGNDEISFFFFDDRSALIRMEVIQDTLTFINRKHIPIKNRIQCDCRGKSIAFELNTKYQGYQDGCIKIYKSDNAKTPEMCINFDYFFYNEYGEKKDN